MIGDREFTTAGRIVGDGHPILVVAEVGANHDGDVGTAHEMIDMVVDCGADAVKFQTYTSGELLSDSDRQISWGPPGREKHEQIGALFDRVKLPREAHEELFDHATDRGIIPFSTPFSEDGIDFLATLTPAMVKIASSDLCHLDLLRHAARLEVPILMSTGKATIAEVDVSVSAVRDAGCTDLALLHCIASYPAPHSALNLAVITTLRQMYPDTVIGYSDHSVGTTAAIAAVVLGASIIEKHVTYDTQADGPDHWFSSGPGELRSLVDAVREAEASIGTGRKSITPEEVEERRVSTRSLVTATSIAAGTPLRREHIKVVRPGTGIHPFDLPKVLGLATNTYLPENTALQWGHLG